MNAQKRSERGVLCTFLLPNALRATTACPFSTSQLPKVLRAWCGLRILTWTCASRHDAVHFFNSSTSKSAPNPSTSQLPKTLEKHSFSRLFYLFACLDLLSSDSFSSLIFFLLRFSSLALPTSAFSSVRIVGSWQDLWKRLLGKMSATDGASVYKISTRGVLARSLYKISIRGLLARSLHKVSLSEISIPDLSKTSPCKWSLGKISSWQDLFLARSLLGKISATNLCARPPRKLSIRGLLARSLYKLSTEHLLSRSPRKLSIKDLLPKIFAQDLLDFQNEHSTTTRAI